jgi:hypothetical protein
LEKMASPCKFLATIFPSGPMSHTDGTPATS